jgi:signal transduction histidine kinase
MFPEDSIQNSRGVTRILGWRRVGFTLGASILLGLVIGQGWKTGLMSLLIRMVVIGLVGMLMFGLFEQWPQRLPAWLARWALQLLGVALSMPLATLAIYLISTPAGAPPFWQVQDRLIGFLILTFLGILVAPWLAMAALLRQISGEASHQALAFELERSELERKALDARLRLLQAQIEPHFLFNTLANVRELVDTGSPRASEVLGSLIAYLRAAVPSLHAPSATLEQELGLVRAYLEVMHMRMPDRLRFTVHADEEALPLYCPPMTLLTLVENAVRHGIAPSEEGGRIEIDVAVRDGQCRVEVVDSGVGLDPAGDSMGTGLSNLNERLQLVFGGEAQMHLLSLDPHGVRAELVFPALRSRP